MAVPRQMSVIGFDDMPIARDVTPALTTVRLPLVEMGARAMSLALGVGAADAPRRGAPRRAGPPRHRRPRPTVHPRHRGFRATRTAR